MKSLKKNLIYQSAYQLLMVISPLITSPYIARTLGNEMYGVYSYYYSIAYYFGIFAILGLANYGNRTIAKVKAERKEQLSRVFFQMMAMQICMLMLVSFVYFVSVPFWGGEYKTNAIIEWMYILSVGLDISWFYFGIEEFKTTTQRSFIVKIGIIICILLFVKTPNDLNKYTAIMAGGMLISSLILWSQLSKYIVFTKIHAKEIVQHVKPNLALFVPVVSLALFHYTDKIMLGTMSTWKELGYYTNSDKIVNIPMGLINGLGVVMLPRISALSVSNESNKIEKYVNTSIVLSLWAGIALSFGIKAIDSDFIPFFFGKGYMRCAELLEWLSVVIIIKAISNVLRTQYLIPMEKDKEFNISVIAAAVVNVIFNYFLIPLYGAMGAVVGTLIAESIVLILYYYFSKKIIVLKKVIFPGVIFLVGGIVMDLILEIVKVRMSIKSLFVRLVVEVCIGGIIYCMTTLSGMILIKKIKDNK